MEPTHASFFSGVGGLDLGLERAGWRTVSFSEIDPYASAVLAERWPGVPNLGDIVAVARASVDAELREAGGQQRHEPWTDARLWTGGFPCQDLSVAGKRRGMVEGSRSNLAHAFLDLVERHRPPAILLENVPGLLSSHRGRDMAALTGRLAELGYGVAYRVLDARHFGVPQRRRRVFILGLRSGPDDPTGRLAAERAAAVLAVGTRCPRHPATGGEAGTEPTAGTIVGTIPAGLGHHGNGGHSSQAVNSGHVILGAVRAGGHGDPGIGRDGDEKRLVISPPPDPGGVRAADGLAGRLDGGGELAIPIRTEPGEHLVAFHTAGYGGSVSESEVSTLQASDARLSNQVSGVIGSFATSEDPLLPLGLDSHRYRCCGNGVVAPVSEWLGRQLIASLENAA